MRKTRMIAMMIAAVMTLSCFIGIFTVNAAAFEPAGDKQIYWFERAYSQIKMDGDLSEWDGIGAETYDLTPHFAAWIGEVPADFTVKARFAADTYYLYIALDITDKDFSPVDPTDAAAVAAYKGDAVQFGIDFGGMQGDVVDTDSLGWMSVLATQNSYLTYAPLENTSECVIVAENFSIYPNGSLDAREYGDEVYAASTKTENGWSTEIRIAWNSMFNNMADQIMLENAYTFDASHPLEVSMLISYFDADEKGADHANAMGTFKSTDDVSATPKPSANGLNLYLNYEEGRVIYIEDERFVQVEEIPSAIVTPPGTTEESESESESESEPTAPVETDEQTQASKPTETTASPAESDTNDVTSDGGCGAAVAAGVLTLPVALLGVAILTKKNKQD